MRAHRAIVVALTAVLLAPTWAPAGPDTDCDEMPDPARWQDAGPPDTGLERMRITVHRGAAELAPENTMPAFEYAIAYGHDMIEVDVQQTADGRYVAFHDYQVAAKTDGTGLIHTMTYDQVKVLNVADNDKWRGTEYDPSYMPDLEEVLAFASEHEVGINFDIKETVYNTAGIALLAAEYPGVIERSIFQPYVPGRSEQIIAVAPEAQVMINPQFETPPAIFYAFGAEYDWFGSDMDYYTPEVIAAIHDSCDLAQPNVYSSDRDQEAAGILAARAAGADGAMVNHPDVTADVLDLPVATTIEVVDSQACLVGHLGLGLPGKVLKVNGKDLTTARGGCVTLPAHHGRISFEGDGSALPTSI